MVVGSLSSDKGPVSALALCRYGLAGRGLKEVRRPAACIIREIMNSRVKVQKQWL